MISQEKSKILTPIQKLPKNVGNLGKNNCCQKLEKVSQSAINRPIWWHWSWLRCDFATWANLRKMNRCSDWLKLVTWLETSNHSALFHSGVMVWCFYERLTPPVHNRSKGSNSSLGAPKLAAKYSPKSIEPSSAKFCSIGPVGNSHWGLSLT